MTDPVAAWAAGVLAGASVGFFYGSRMSRDRDPFHRWWRRSPYSPIWIAATKEDADKFRSKIVKPLVWGDPPEPMTVEEWARLDEGPTARSTSRHAPTTTKPEITPAGQRATCRVYRYNPATIAECGGPCEEGGPGACDCGAITWTDQPVKPEFPSPTKIREVAP